MCHPKITANTSILVKILHMIVKLSSITFYSILDGKFGIGTQNLHVNPSTNENQRIFISSWNVADIV